MASNSSDFHSCRAAAAAAAAALSRRQSSHPTPPLSLSFSACGILDAVPERANCVPSPSIGVGKMFAQLRVT